jgi:hypothetical protein
MKRILAPFTAAVLQFAIAQKKPDRSHLFAFTCKHSSWPDRPTMAGMTQPSPER